MLREIIIEKKQKGDIKMNLLIFKISVVMFGAFGICLIGLLKKIKNLLIDIYRKKGTNGNI